jgi:hypothetical protein
LFRYAVVIFVFKAVVSITDVIVLPDGIAIAKLSSVVPVFSVNGLEPLVNILFDKDLIFALVAVPEVIEDEGP